MVYLTDWVPSQTITVYLSATRWDHSFKLHTDYGDTDLPLVKGAMQGHYVISAGFTTYQKRAGACPNSSNCRTATYWYFDATVTFPSNRTHWWVYDVTADERSPAPDDRHNLSR